MRRVFVRLAFAFLWLLCSVEHAAACTCVNSPSPCDSLQTTPVVFVGLVRSIEEESVEINRFGQTVKVRTGLTAHFIVEEALKGIGNAEADVVTGGGGGDCGYNFKAGERYLVYAYKNEQEALGSSMSRTVVGGGGSPQKADALSTNICSRTQPLSRAQDDVELLRALVKGNPQTRLFGSIHEYVSRLGDFERDAQYKPKAGLTVKAEGPAGFHEAVTDSDGRYRLEGLKPGKYKVKLTLPPTFGMRYSFHQSVFDVEVTQGCWAADVDFTVMVDGHIRGRIFDAQGKPVGEQVQVTIVPYESAGAGAVESRHEYTDKQGRYDFDGVPPGRYLLGINIADVPNKVTPYSKLYHPSGNTPTRANVITVGEGQKLDGFDFHLPPPLAEHKITGTAYLQDGKPAAGATLELYDLERPEKSVWGVNVETDAQGRFTVNAFKGRRYQLRAYLDEDYFAGKGLQSEAVEVDTNLPASPIKLILNRPGIFRHQL